MIGALGIVFSFILRARSHRRVEKFTMKFSTPLKARARTIFLLILICITALLLSIFQISFNEESVVIRQELNVAAVKIWSGSPIFGVGLGNFLVKLPQVIPTRTIYFLQPVHNIYLLVLSEAGVIGLGFFLWLIYLGFKNILINKKFIIRSPACRQAGLSFIIVLLLGLVDHYSLTLQQGQLLLTILFAITI